MRVRPLMFLLLIVLSCAQLVLAQTEQTIQRKAKGKNVNPDEMVSFKSDVPYAKAIQSLGELSKKLDGRLIIDRSPLEGKEKIIGINIESMYWKDALELILRSNQLWYNDYPEYMEIASFEEIGKKQGDQVQKEGSSRNVSPASSSNQVSSNMTPVSSVAMTADSSEIYWKMREVSFSTVFFDVNRTKLAESGMDLSIVRGSGMNLGVSLKNATALSSTNTPTISASPRSSTMPMTLDAVFKMFESDQLGEVIARPQITVRSGLSSTFQVGDNFSVLEKDFSGNTVQKFYPTGTILIVRPRIFQVGEMVFLDIQYSIEKSTFEASSVTTVIHKTTSSGSLTLLNGEEGYVGGMYSNEETLVRSGVPLLKDLPWWFFGLRYIFGYDSKKVIKRELIVLIKAEVLPSLEDRATQKAAGVNLIKDTRQDMDKDLLKRKTDK
jgi:general secretion pathway protein D